MPVIYIGLFYLGYIPDLLDPLLWLITFVGYAFLFLPVFILHITYFIKNRGTVLIIDSESFTIEEKGRECKYYLRDIKKIRKSIFSDYRHSKEQRNWFPAPWRKYGYLRIVTEDDKTYFLTSLMIDPINPPLEVNEIKYHIFPLLDEPQEDLISEKESRLKQKKLTIANYKRKFSDFTEDQLKKKTVENGFVKEAEMAASELLNEKYTATNN